MEHDFSWIYLLFFLTIPLARIIPRLLSKIRGQKSSVEGMSEESITPKFDDLTQKSEKEFRKPSTKNMLVLGELNRGTKTFEKIQKNTGFTSKELDTILEELEKNDFLRVQQKQGMLGNKIELYPTEKGIKEYYS